MIFSEYFYVTLGQIILGIGLIALLIIALSTHIITRKEIIRSYTKETEIKEKLEKTEAAIKEKIIKAETEQEVKDRLEKIEIKINDLTDKITKTN